MAVLSLMAMPSEGTTFRCDLFGCVGTVKGKRCRAARVMIDRRMLRAEGAFSIRRSRLPRRGAAGHGCRTVWSSKGRHPCRLQATTQPTPISDWAAIQKNKDQ
jgi:hypothetical protein